MTAEAAPHAIVLAAGGRRVLATRVLIGAAVLLAFAALLSLSVGPTGITLASLPRVVASWLGGSADVETAREQLVLIDIRLPRTLLAVFVGASLAVAGAMMQGLFRNPLADPGLIGVSSGAALAAVARSRWPTASPRRCCARSASTHCLWRRSSAARSRRLPSLASQAGTDG